VPEMVARGVAEAAIRTGVGTLEHQYVMFS